MIDRDRFLQPDDDDVCPRWEDRVCDCECENECALAADAEERALDSRIFDLQNPWPER